MEKLRKYLTLVCLAALCLYPTGIRAQSSLRLGDRGEAVRNLQLKLDRWGYEPGAVDGVFGEETRRAVIRFQKNNALSADGIVGPATAAALGLKLSQSSASGTSGSDLELLARLIHGEARGESYTGKVAVAAVVLNRVESPRFPNTLSGVIYQKHAFTAVSDGQIHLTPDESAYRAARDALNGWDPTGGALYYYNPAKTTDDWIYSRTVVAVIGNHRFAV